MRIFVRGFNLAFGIIIFFWIMTSACFPVFADAISDQLLSEANVTSDLGGPLVEVWEDVKPIKNIGPQPGKGSVISNSELAKYASVVKAAEGQKLLDRTMPAGLAFPFKSFEDFLAQYFYLDRGSFYYPDGSPPVWGSEEEIHSFPYEYPDTKDPHTRKFWLCLGKGEFSYFKPTTYAPDSKSCFKHKWLCNYPPCKKAVKEEQTDADGNKVNVEIEPEDHSGQKDNNIYLGLKDYLKKNSLEVSKGYQDEASGRAFEIRVKDRTPPQIIGCVGGNFPELGKTKPATTGDRYEVEGLKIIDNSPGDIGTCLCLGMIYATPDLNWKNNEKWITEDPIYVKPGSDANYVIMPNTCNGVMRYSVFAWDKSNWLNPGEPGIKPDSPKDCYGLSDPPKGYADLGDDPKTAKEFPLTFGGMQSLDPTERRGTGFLWVTDNDLPNVLIKIQSVKDSKAVFFPPPIDPASSPGLSIFPPQAPAGAPSDFNPGKDSYVEFLTKDVKSSDVTYTADMVGGAVPYFTVFHIEPSKYMSFDEAKMLSKFEKNADIDFIRKNLRLEDFNCSDTKKDGTKIISDSDSFGQRNGFGQTVVALLKEPLQEDVEYKISVWADDNVKWSTTELSGAVLDDIRSFKTGVVNGKISLRIPNQNPTYSANQNLDPNQYISKDLQAVFREPTIKNPKISSESDLTSGRFPFVEVRAEDFVGNRRTIRLYFKISDENPKIKVIERKHGLF